MSASRIIAVALTGLLSFAVRADAQSVLKVPSQFPTIQAAVDAAADGDEIQVSSGTYAENVVVDGVSGLALVAKGSVLIDGGGTGSALTVSNSLGVYVAKLGLRGGDPHGLLISDSEEVIVEKVDIEGGAGDAIHTEGSDYLVIEKVTVTGGDGDGISIDDADFVLVEKVRIEGVAGDGISLSAGLPETSDDIWILKALIMDVGGDGIDMNGLFNVVAKTKVFGAGGDGMRVESASQTDSFFLACMVKDVGGDGFELAGSDDWLIKSKVLSTGGAGVRLGGVGDHLLVAVKVTKPQQEGVVLEPGADGCSVQKTKVTQPGLTGLVVDSDFNYLGGVKVSKAGGHGVHATGTSNMFEKTKASGSVVFDLSDTAGGNTYEKCKFGSIDPGGFDP